jgi:excisionase family DNA binding protein
MEVIDQFRLGRRSLDTGRLISVDEAAERMGVSTRTVRRLVQQRRIRYLRFGRLIRLSIWDVDEFLSSVTVEPIEKPSHRTDDYPGNQQRRRVTIPYEATP